MLIVTGANGFIGSAIVHDLNQKGIHDVVVVDSVPPKDRPQPLSNKKYARFLLHTELWSFLETAQAQQEVTWIVHMGACSSTTETNAQFLYENNTLYTQRLHEWCAKYGKKFIYASSAATYGAGELGYRDDLDPSKLHPLNLYGKSKADFDTWLMQQKQNSSPMPVKWYGLKFFNVYGPNEYHKGPMASLVYKSFHLIKKTGQMGLFKSYDPNYQDGEQMRDFVYVKDVTSWILELMDKQPTSGLYNMGFGKARTWVDLSKAIFSAMDVPMKIEWLEMPENIRHQYQYYTCAEMDRFQALGMSPAQWSIEKGVQDYIRNYLRQDDPTL